MRSLIAVGLFLVGLFCLSQQSDAYWQSRLQVSVGSAATLVFGSAANSSNTTLTTIDFGTLTYGSGCTRVVVGVQWYTSTIAAISGITIGGTSLAEVSGSNSSGIGSSQTLSDVWQSSAALAGSSGDVQVTLSLPQSYGISVALYCLTTTTPAAAHAVANGTTSTATISQAITIPANGVGLVLTATQNGKTLTPSNTTVDADQAPAAGVNQYYGHTTATGSVTVASSWTGNDNAVVSLVSWGP